MADNNSVADRISVEFVLDSKKFEKGIDEIDKSLDDTVKELGEYDSETKRAQKQSESFGNSAKKAADGIGREGDATSKATREVEQLGTKTDKAAESIKKHGTESEKAAGKITEVGTKTKTAKTEMEAAKTVADNFNKVLGAFGVAFSLTAIIGQVKEFAESVKKARDEYDSLYNKIYFSAGGFSKDQKKIADSLMGEFGKDMSDAISNAIGGISTFFPNIDATQLEAVSKELVTMQKRGFGDVGSIVNGLNDVVKKYNLSISDMRQLLTYLSGTSMDTGESVTNLLNSVASADEMAKVLNKTVYEMINMYGDAKASGNAADMQGIADRFETMYAKAVDEMTKNVTKLDTMNRMKAGGIDDSSAAAAMKAIEKEGIDLSEATLKELTDALVNSGIEAVQASGIADILIKPGISNADAAELAKTEVTKLFQQVNEEASKAATQTEASKIWADFFGTGMGRISNMFADMSMASANQQYQISYDQRKLALENKTLYQQSEERKTSADIDAQIEAEIERQKQEFLSSEFAQKRSETALNATKKGGEASGWLAGRAVEVQQFDKDTGILSILEPLSFLSGIIPALAPLGFAATALKEGSNMVVNDANGVSQEQQQQKESVSELNNELEKSSGLFDGILETVKNIGDSLLEALGIGKAAASEIEFPDGKELAPEETADNVKEFTEEALNPMNESLDNISTAIETTNANSEMYAELSQSTVVPAIDVEKSSVDALAESWRRAAEAKEAYNSA